MEPVPFNVLGWETASIDDDVHDLAAKGITFLHFGFLEQDALGIWSAPSGERIAWFKDPDGNTLSLSQHVWHSTGIGQQALLHQHRRTPQVCGLLVRVRPSQQIAVMPGPRAEFQTKG